MRAAVTSAQRSVLVGVGSAASQVAQSLATAGWECTLLAQPAGVLRRLRVDRDIDLLLLAPGDEPNELMELCRQVKFDTRTSVVSVIAFVGWDNTEVRARMFESGANDCIELGASPGELRIRLNHAFQAKRARDSLEDANGIVASLANAIEGRDAYTRGHVERVSTYSLEVGRRLGLSADELDMIRVGGLVHDIGKVAVPDQVLNKPGKLTEIERELIERHPVVGYDILQPLRTFRDVLPIVRWHHERPNGKGYPDGLAGDALPLLPRIVAVADVFDALSTARPYRPAFGAEKCRAILLDMGGQGDLDESLVSMLLEIVERAAATMPVAVEKPVRPDPRDPAGEE